MPLQTAIDIIHEIRESFPHVAAFLTESKRAPFRDGSTVYIIGVYQGEWRESRRSWVISSAWDWTEFLLMYKIFANL